MSAPAPTSPHLLVVEADPALQLILQEALAEMGYVSTSASSLDQALRLLNQQHVDLIVTDSFSSTSQEALAPLRPLLALSHPLPVILCTAWPLTETVVKQEGFAGLVLQPFELDHLVTMVAECLNQPWSPAQLRQAEVRETLYRLPHPEGCGSLPHLMHRGCPTLPLDHACLSVRSPGHGMGSGTGPPSGTGAILCRLAGRTTAPLPVSTWDSRTSADTMAGSLWSAERTDGGWVCEGYSRRTDQSSGASAAR